MAIKNLTLPNTGIYQQKITSASIQGPSDIEGLRDVVHLLATLPEENQPLPSLPQLETTAKQIVLEYVSSERGEVIDESSWMVVYYHIDNILKRARENIHEKFQGPLSEEQQRKLTRSLIKVERAGDARMMLHNLNVISAQLERGSADVAVAHAVWLGMAYERLKVRDHEPAALTGHKNMQGAKKGGLARKGSADAEYRQIKADFLKSGLSQRRFCKINKIPRSKLERALKKVDS